jgi:acyl carrier protein
LATQIRDQLARVLGTSPTKLDVEQSLLNLGIDSLMAVEIGNQIQAMVGVDVPAMKFMEGISIAGLAAYVIDQLAPTDGDVAAAEVAVASNEVAQVADQVEQLSDAEVDALLLELAGANGHNAPGANGSGNGVHAAEEVRQ